jgi:hypothetical protein
MKAIFLFILLVLNYNLSLAQFCHNYGGSDWDELLSVTINRSSQNIIAVGTSYSSNYDVVPVTYPLNFGEDAWLLVLDSFGTILDSRCYGGDQREGFNKIITTANGGYACIGICEEDGFDVSGTHGATDMWLVQLDSNLQILWQHAYGGTMLESGYDLLQLDDGGFVLTGQSHLANGDITANYGERDFWIIRTDSLGNIVWQYSYGGPSFDQPYFIKKWGTRFVAGGYLYQPGSGISGYHALDEAWLLVVDENGNPLWNRCYGGSGSEFLSDGIVLADGNLLMVGYSSSNDGDLSSNAGSTDGWLMIIDTTGAVVQCKSIGGPWGEYFSAITPLDNGNYALTGTIGSQLPGSNPVHGSFDIWLAVVDPNFDLVATLCIGGSAYDEGTAVTNTPGSVVIAGISESNDGDLPGNYGYKDGAVSSVSNGLINSVASVGNSIGFEQAGSRLSWTFGSAGNGQAVTELVDLQGRVAARKAWSVFPSGNRIEWLLPDGLASGIYLARISLQGETRTDRAWVRGY